jgi:hypothetical protein
MAPRPTCQSPVYINKMYMHQTMDVPEIKPCSTSRARGARRRIAACCYSRSTHIMRNNKVTTIIVDIGGKEPSRACAYRAQWHTRVCSSNFVIFAPPSFKKVSCHTTLPLFTGASLSLVNNFNHEDEQIESSASNFYLSFVLQNFTLLRVIMFTDEQRLFPTAHHSYIADDRQTFCSRPTKVLIYYFVYEIICLE